MRKCFRAADLYVNENKSSKIFMKRGACMCIHSHISLPFQCDYTSFLSIQVFSACHVNECTCTWVGQGLAVPASALPPSSNTGTFTVETPGWERRKLVSINHSCTVLRERRNAVGRVNSINDPG